VTAFPILLAACSAIVDASDVPIRCTVDEGCPSGFRCVDGSCREGRDCVPGAEEICDGRDNNCTDGVDEGHDLDGDGATWCGGGIQSQRDCDDDDIRVFPGASEVCDGADNDCDLEVDEDSCGPGEACDAFAGECQPFDCRRHGCPLEGGGCNEETGVCDGPDCRDDGPPCDTKVGFEVCDPLTGRCVSQQGPLGSPCASHAECLSVFCLDPNVARLDATGSFCSSLCCTNDDCPEGFVCWASGSGANACVARDVLGFAEGGSADGAACGGGEDCASGLCGDGTCVSPCCTDADCAASTCGIVHADGRAADDLVLACRVSDGGGFDDLCGGGGDCQTGLCLDTACTKGCCSSAECGVDFVCTFAWNDTTSDYFRVCAFRGGIFGYGVGDQAVGEACAVAQDCRSTQCEPTGVCTDSCCSDDDCPDGWACRPRTLRDGFATNCEPG
jgi:hypothetical protein